MFSLTRLEGQNTELLNAIIYKRYSHYIIFSASTWMYFARKFYSINTNIVVIVL